MANENAIQATGTFITRKGLSLITKLVADKGTLSFSRGAVGVGRPPEGYSPDSMIALSSYKMDAEIADYGVQDDKAFVTLQISSDQVAEGFLLTEVGLYATDPDEGEVLYAYMDISTDPTYIYANGSATRTKFAEFTLYVLIGTVERVTAAVTPGSIITKDTFKADKLPVSDTSGILGEIGKVATGQAMFDALAHKVVEELVTNNDLIATLASYVTTEALTTKLAEYILKNKIVDNFLATSADTVLSGTMGAELKRLLDVLNTNFDGKYGIKRLLTSEDDLNNITDNGIYWYLTENVPSHAPYNNASVVEVFGSSSSSTQKMQRVTRYGVSGQSAFRPLIGSAGWLDWSYDITDIFLAAGTNTKISVKNAGGTTRMTMDCTSPNEGYVGLEGSDGAWYRRLKFLTDGRIIYAHKLTNGVEVTKVITDKPS